MPIYRIGETRIDAVPRTSFEKMGLYERRDLQRLLRECIDVIAPGTMVLTEEFGEWSVGARRIDLLALDKRGRLVVVELKRTEDGGHMELQALRYAALVSPMTLEQAVEAHRKYLAERGAPSLDAEDAIREFLGGFDTSS